MIARRVIVRGRVQGVGFRESMLDVAHDAGVAGWVRNLRDGTVEAWLQGADDAVATMLAWCARGPGAARVDAVDTREVAPDPALEGFHRRPTA